MTATAAAAPGFHPQPGTDFTSTPALRKIAAALDTLGKRKHIAIYGLSGGRPGGISPSTGQPVGSPTDPHALLEAGDIAVNSLMRSSAGQLTDADLESVGLYRPFAGSQEINHVQLMPGTAIADPAGHQSALGAATNAVTAPFKAVESVGAFLAKLTDPHFWIRVVEVIIGAVLILMGLKSFTGGTIDPIAPLKTAAAVA